MNRRWEQPCRWSFLHRATLAAGEEGRESGVPRCKRGAPSRPIPSHRLGPAPSQPPYRLGYFRGAGLLERVSSTCLPGRQKDVGGPRGRGARGRAEGLLTWPLAGGAQEAGQQDDDEAQQPLEPHPRGPVCRGVPGGAGGAPGSGGQGEQRPASGRLTQRRAARSPAGLMATRDGRCLPLPCFPPLLFSSFFFFLSLPLIFHKQTMRG